MPVTMVVLAETVLPAGGLAWKAICLLGKHPAGNGWLEGGRSLLLESAQEATLTSVATPLSRVNATVWLWSAAGGDVTANSWKAGAD